MLLLHSVPQGNSPTATLALLLGRAALGSLWGKLHQVGKFVVGPIIDDLMSPIWPKSNLQPIEGVVVSGHDYLANNYQVLEAVVVSGHVQYLDLMANLIREGSKGLVVVTLDLHFLDCRGHLDPVVVPIYLKVF